MDWTEEYDVVVAGSGGGGVTGAYTAAREGLSVLMAEQVQALREWALPRTVPAD